LSPFSPSRRRFDAFARISAYGTKGYFRLTDSAATERLLFPEIFAKSVNLEFDQRQGSSGGGAVLLKAAERRYGLIASMSGCLRDPRQAGKVDHSLRNLFAQRGFSIGGGYADASDSARWAAACPNCASAFISTSFPLRLLGSTLWSVDSDGLRTRAYAGKLAKACLN
jgi:hypothetical protein